MTMIINYRNRTVLSIMHFTSHLVTTAILSLIILLFIDDMHGSCLTEITSVLHDVYTVGINLTFVLLLLCSAQ